jgi:hypothetical protein
MTSSPIPLDNLISYVRSLHESAAPLDDLSTAVSVAAALDEQSDALIGYFVDQARRSGAPWSEIGASMGVSKQAVQKRFVAKTDLSDLVPDGGLFSRFTPRARSVVAAARRIASAAGTAETTPVHLTLALLTQPEGVAAVVLRKSGVMNKQLFDSFDIAEDAGTSEASVPEGQVPFTLEAKEALRGALKAALRLGHNYIGTEHILLGVIATSDETAEKLETLGVQTDAIEARIVGLLAGEKAKRAAGE